MQENIKIDYLDINKIKPYKWNAKKHPQEQIDQIVKSIEQFGNCDPIAVWGEKNTIVEGHGRYLALKQLGVEGEIPVIHLDHLSDDERRAYGLVHNKLTMNSGFDFDLLEQELNEIDPAEFDMADFGFFQDDETEDKAPTEVTEDDFDETTVTESVCKRGQIWQLGEHRLMCGDSTNADDVAHLMNGEKADMVFTDPPYGVNYAGGAKIENGKIKSNDREIIKNDALGYHDLYVFLSDVFSSLRTFTKVKAPIYVFYAHSRTREFLNAFHDKGLKQRSIIIWHKIGGGTVTLWPNT